MCFSPQADVAAAVIVGGIGIATLRQVRTRRELIVGSLPLLFALHQFVEAFVWLGLRGEISMGVANVAKSLYVLYAYPVLPLIVPIGFYLLEPSARHRRRLVPFVVLGCIISATLVWQITRQPVVAEIHGHGISYFPNVIFGYPAAIGYIVATCGPALFSSRRYLQWFGVANVVAAATAFAVHRYEFASIWCMYAGLASLLVYEHFRRQRSFDRRIAAPQLPV